MFENLRSNLNLPDRWRLWPSNSSATQWNLIFPVGDEVAPSSAAWRSAEPATNAFVPLRSFRFGCAALQNLRRKASTRQRCITPSKTASRIIVQPMKPRNSG